METGGESTQYESIRTVTVTPPKDKGQLGGISLYSTQEGNKLPATQESTISPLKILSKDDNGEEQCNNGERAARDPTLTGPQTAGMTSGVSGEVDKGTWIFFPAVSKIGHMKDSHVNREILDKKKG
ncbi:hypothetical protein TMatcc_001454 [Talaromyces marneffei ATCC 18224]